MSALIRFSHVAAVFYFGYRDKREYFRSDEPSDADSM